MFATNINKYSRGSKHTPSQTNKQANKKLIIFEWSFESHSLLHKGFSHISQFNTINISWPF